MVDKISFTGLEFVVWCFCILNAKTCRDKHINTINLAELMIKRDRTHRKFTLNFITTLKVTQLLSVFRFLINFVIFTCFELLID